MSAEPTERDVEALTDAEREALRTSGSWPHVGTDLFVAVERILSDRIAEARREALREAADAYWADTSLHRTPEVATWLRDRAAALRGDA